MKNILLTLLLLVAASASYAQQFRMVANPSGFPTQLNDSTYQVSVLFAADQTGNGFLPTQIVADGSYRIFYQNEAIFKITGLSNQTFSSADLTIVYFAGSTTPVGQALVYDATASAGIPQAPANGSGSSPVLNAAIATYNAGKSEGSVQQLSRSGVEVTLSGGGGIVSVEDGDADPSNELQSAAEVIVTPAGNLGSTDVQAALQEHQADLDALAAGAGDGVATSGAYDPLNTELDINVAAPGSNFSIDVAALLDNTDAQAISLTGNTLGITGNASTVDLSAYLDNTDQQQLDTFRLLGTDLELSLSGDGEAAKVVDLSSLQDGVGMDNFFLGVNGASYFNVTDGAALSLNAGTGINITRAFGDYTITSTATDDQTLSLATNTLSIESGNSVDLSAYLDNTDNQTAAEVNVTPAGNLASTNVQSALQELQSDVDAKTWLKQELEASNNVSILGDSIVTYELDNLGQYTLRVFDGTTASRLLMTPSLTSLINGSSSTVRLESDGAKLRYGNSGAINSIEAKASGIEINTPNVSSALAEVGQVLKLQADGSVEYEDAIPIPDLTAAPLASIATNAATYGFAQAYTDGTNIRLGRTIASTTLHQFYVDATGNILGNGTHTITASFAYSVGTVYYVQDDGSLASTADNDGDVTDYDSAAVYVLQDNADGTYVVQLKEPRHFMN